METENFLTDKSRILDTILNFSDKPAK
jgi:hypothetical protein